MSTWKELCESLTAALHPTAPPAPEGVPAYDAPMAPPTPDGRPGRVSAGCVFWMKGTETTFATAPADHGNCSVGSLTHGLLSLSEAAGRADVSSLVSTGWVDETAFASIPTVKTRPGGDLCHRGRCIGTCQGAVPDLRKPSPGGSRARQIWQW
jgi:hypothetical protein